MISDTDTKRGAKVTLGPESKLTKSLVYFPDRKAPLDRPITPYWNAWRANEPGYRQDRVSTPHSNQCPAQAPSEIIHYSKFTVRGENKGSRTFLSAAKPPQVRKGATALEGGRSARAERSPDGMGLKLPRTGMSAILGEALLNKVIAENLAKVKIDG